MGTSTRLDDRPNGSSTNIDYKKLDTSLLDGRSHGSSRAPLRKSAPDKGMKGRWFDGYLRVSGWDSEYQSVQKLLRSCRCVRLGEALQRFEPMWVQPLADLTFGIRCSAK